jgi:predicted GNAT family N-acyltransferase
VLIQVAAIRRLSERQDPVAGLGRRLMAELMSYVTANAKSGAFVGLMAAKGLRKYYESLGFQSRPEDAPGMFMVIMRGTPIR